VFIVYLCETWWRIGQVDDCQPEGRVVCSTPALAATYM